MRSHIEQKSLVRRHIAQLRQCEYFRSVPIWVIPENNLAHESSHIEKFVTKMPHVYTYHENEEQRSGVRKSHQNTEDYQILYEDMLRGRRITFDRNLFTVSKGHFKPSGDCTSIKNELRDQLERYHWEIKEAKDSFGDRRITMTGKMGGAQDDLYVATAMLCFWPAVIRKENAARRAANGRNYRI